LQRRAGDQRQDSDRQQTFDGDRHDVEAKQFDAATTQGQDSEQALVDDDSGFHCGKGDAGACRIVRSALAN